MNISTIKKNAWQKNVSNSLEFSMDIRGIDFGVPKSKGGGRVVMLLSLNIKFDKKIETAALNLKTKHLNPNKECNLN